jgi:hypothetical protein
MKTVLGGFWRVLNRHDIIILMGTTPADILPAAVSTHAG